jgi:hypothetical protein
MRPFTLKATLRCYLQMIPALKVTAVNTKNLVNLLDTSLVCSTSRHFTRRLIGQLNTSVNTSVHSSHRSIQHIGLLNTSVHSTRRSIQHVGLLNTTSVRSIPHRFAHQLALISGSTTGHPTAPLSPGLRPQTDY